MRTGPGSTGRRTRGSAQSVKSRVSPVTPLPSDPTPSAALEPPNIPEDLKIGRAGAICITVLVLQGLYSLVALPLIPSLISNHPVLLETLRGSTASLVAGGAFARIGRASLVLALLAPIPALMMADPFFWWAGRLFGPAAAQYMGGQGARGRRRVDRAVRAIERFDSFAVVLAPFLPIPSALIYAAAGWGKMRFLPFLALDILGTMLWVGLIVGLGYAIGHPAVSVAHDIGHYSLIATIVLIVLVFAFSFTSAIRNGDFREPPPAGPPDPPPDEPPVL